MTGNKHCLDRRAKEAGLPVVVNANDWQPSSDSVNKSLLCRHTAFKEIFVLTALLKAHCF